MADDKALRAQLAEFLDWKNAHVGFDDAVKGIPPKLRGVVPEGFAHSAWQIVEHMRIAQHDILDFCRNPRYKEKKWPDDYWPKSPAPRAASRGPASIAGVSPRPQGDAAARRGQAIDLFATIPHGSGQTYLRELLLVADHTAYHVAQIVALRRQLGIWK